MNENKTSNVAAPLEVEGIEAGHGISFDPTEAHDYLRIDPDATDPLDVLDIVNVTRQACNVLELAQVRAARERGYSWAQIGEALRTSKQNVQQRYGDLI